MPFGRRRAQRALEWLKGVPLPRVAATIGARLGPDWTVEATLEAIGRSRAGRDRLDAPLRPLGYLVVLLEEALTGEHEPPHPARRWDQHVQEVAAARRRDVVDQAATTAAELAATRAGWNDRAAAARAERASGGTARHAALAAARAAAPRRPRRRPRDRGGRRLAGGDTARRRPAHWARRIADG
ncbi:hypothetical protein [Micromonospora sp. NPDC050695]|uniref:hypothetical protein n=1 Tax=Micromonospora sp. NPDC050695 TaxID=3154938 RepID=UPI00340B8701